MTTTKIQYGWSDFEEDESTDEIEGKYILTIFDIGEDGFQGDKEIAILVHRDCQGRYPLNGTVADGKRVVARRIVDLLNMYGFDE